MSLSVDLIGLCSLMLIRPPACCCLDCKKRRPEKIIYLDRASMSLNFLPSSNAACADGAMCLQPLVTRGSVSLELIHNL